MAAMSMEKSLVCTVVTEMITQGHVGSFAHLETRILKRLCYEVTVACSFTAYGCPFTGTGIEVFSHENACNFFPNSDVSSIEPSHMKCCSGYSMEELILAELECPVCNICIKPPIWMCFNGHQLCNDCTKQVQLCPMCRGLKAVATNFSLGYFHSMVEVPCRNASYGCVVRKNGIDIAEHEVACSFFPRSCPLNEVEKCRWIGLTTQIVDHCKTEHSDKLFMEPEQQWDLHGFFKNMCSYNLFYIYGVLFRFTWGVRDQNVMFSANYIAETPFNKRFTYEISIFGTNQELVRSIGECAYLNYQDYGNFQCICKDSILLPYNHLRKYREENRDVRFIVKIRDGNVKTSQTVSSKA